jgi:hypothetical protein
VKRIQYDDFKTAVQTIPAEDMPPGVGETRVLQLTEGDTVHEFAYPADAAAKVGGALQGKTVQVAPATALDHLAKGGKPRQ